MRVLRRKTRERDRSVHRLKFATKSRVASFSLCSSVGFVAILQGAITTDELFAYMRCISFLSGLWGLLLLSKYTRRITPSAPEACDTPCPSRLSFNHVSRRAIRLPSKLVLRDIDLSIPFGQHTALVGPLGVGKTTLTKLLSCDLRSKQRCSLNRQRRSSPLQNRRRATISRHRSAGILLLPQ
jgi:ABC-type multidrug transport system fused ATPase/permease subunit